MVGAYPEPPAFSSAPTPRPDRYTGGRENRKAGRREDRRKFGVGDLSASALPIQEAASIRLLEQSNPSRLPAFLLFCLVPSQAAQAEGVDEEAVVGAVLPEPGRALLGGGEGAI